MWVFMNRPLRILTLGPKRLQFLTDALILMQPASPHSHTRQLSSPIEFVSDRKLYEPIVSYQDRSLVDEWEGIFDWAYV